MYITGAREVYTQPSVDRVHPVLGPRLWLFVKNFYMKLKRDFKKILLKKLMECPVTALIAASLQVMNIEERIDLLSAHCQSYVLSVKVKIYS